MLKRRASAALANLDLFEKDKTLERLQPKIEHLSKRLESLKSHPHVGNVRQCGTMVGIELVADKRTKTPFAAARAVGAQVCRDARTFGVLLRPLGDVVVLMPPLCIELEEIDLLVEAASKAIERVTKAQPRGRHR